MKKYLIYIACIAALAWGCNSANKAKENDAHSHESHEGHNHEEGHEHDHDGDHDHDHGEGECDGDHDHDKPTAKSDAGHFADEIVFTKEQAKSVGLEIFQVKPDKFHQVIKTSGQIVSAQGDEVTVAATSSGIVSFNKASLSEGLSVRSGESLLSISAKNLTDGDPAIKAKAAFDVAKQEFQRAENLIKDKLISEREFNDVKLNYENTKVAYQAVGQRSTARGVSLSSPMTGFVKSKLVEEGQYVEMGQPLMTITQNRRLQLRADISERYYKDLGSIVSANFKTPYDKTTYSLADLNGRMISFGKSAANQDYYLPVNFEFDNVGQVISGSYVEVFLLGKVRDHVITVPVSALTEEQGAYFVYLQLDAEGYKKQEVQLGANDGIRVEIRSGLKSGDKVVSKGAYHVKLAASSSAIPHAHEH